jgi:hypothetical protein
MGQRCSQWTRVWRRTLEKLTLQFGDSAFLADCGGVQRLDARLRVLRDVLEPLEIAE